MQNVLARTVGGRLYRALSKNVAGYREIAAGRSQALMRGAPLAARLSEPDCAE